MRGFAGHSIVQYILGYNSQVCNDTVDQRLVISVLCTAIVSGMEHVTAGVCQIHQSERGRWMTKQPAAANSMMVTRIAHPII